MKTSKSGLEISAFPKGPVSWRIDWFGEVCFSNRPVRNNHPSVLVYLSNGEHQRSSVSKRTCWVSIGTLMLLRVGDLWRNQCPATCHNYDAEIFENVHIGPDTVSVVKAGQDLEGDFLLPFDQHPWHSENTHSYCAVVKLQSGQSLVIPCMELIRFYFGSSSELLHRLFESGLSPTDLYKRSEKSFGTKILNLTLAENIPAASRVDIARISQLPIAWKAAKMISDSCVRASNAGEPIYPKTTFPFEGLTTLTASGKWLSRGSNPKATFVVFSLKSCAATFPYKKLFYQTTGVQKPRWVSSPDAAPTESRARRKKPSEDAQELIEQDPSNSLVPERRFIETHRKFPDLINKPSFASHRLATKPLAGPGGAPDSSIPGAIGDPDTGKGVRPIKLEQMSEQERSRLPDFVSGTVKALMSFPNLSAELLSPEDQWTIPTEFLADEDGVIDSRLLISDRGAERPRRVAAFVLSCAEWKGILVILEDKRCPPVIHSGENEVDALRAVETTVTRYLWNEWTGEGLNEESLQERLHAKLSYCIRLASQPRRLGRLAGVSQPDKEPA